MRTKLNSLSSFLFYSVFVFLTMSCSGYYLKKNKNPFIAYNIETIAVPMFHNELLLPNAGAIFTTAFTNMLTSIKDVKVVSENDQPDGFLIGILGGARERNHVYTRGSVVKSTSVAPENVKKRKEMLVPYNTNVIGALKVYLVRNANREQFEFLIKQKDIPFKDLEFILQNSFPINFNFERHIGDEQNAQVDATQSIGNRDEMIKKVATQKAQEFKNLILEMF